MTTATENETISLTRQQVQALRRIVRAATQTPGHKILRFEARPSYAGSLFVVVRSGNPSHRGTMAEAFCRESGHFSVGVRGGIKALDHAKHATKEQARKYPLIYGWRR